MKLYLVWNREMNECVGFSDEGDADYASSGVQMDIMVSTLADSFRECYATEEDTVLPMTTVDITDPA